MFVDPVYARRARSIASSGSKLGRGEFDAGSYKRIAKGGKEIWIQASYNAILDRSGRPFKVVKFATDITEQKMRDLDVEGQLAAINKAQAVIEFTLDGTVLHANENFLNALGYTLERDQGQHHGMFVDAGLSPERGVSPVLGEARPRPFTPVEFRVGISHVTQELDNPVIMRAIVDLGYTGLSRRNSFPRGIPDVAAGGVSGLDI